MDPLSITASVAGVAIPALQCVQHLRNDLEGILNAPSDIVSVREDLLTIEQAITSVQNISDQQWESLGKAVVAQSETGLKLCKKSSSKFQAAIDRWTMHSDDGKLSWRDRAMIGLFRQDQIKSTSTQLQNCKMTLTSVVSTATLHSSLQQTKVAENLTQMISTKEMEITAAITTAKKQLDEVNTKLEDLHLAAQDEDEEDLDQASATSQVEFEKFALKKSLELLQELLKGIQAAAVDARKDQGCVANTSTFGDYNQGVQAGVSNAPIYFSTDGFSVAANKAN
ncbi:unnamed protein product [Clonostachys chloroleuca]|uniref:Azaphilone pigments biosynthesis cluster protein L N-terminal domain-containing protein n=1 Tax=Clonostachys chloroleuca TaxID=1926264 RepID=A0AA35QCL8_9HYPO|nr:unnamed protein product [Clonostachys chloroleuca]